MSASRHRQQGKTHNRNLSQAFEHVSLPYGDEGRRMPGILAPCGTCDHKGQLVVNTIGNTGGDDSEIEWNFIARKLQAKGWHIGRRRQDHRCPRCLNLEILNKAQHKEAVMNAPTPIKPAVTNAALAAAPPASPLTMASIAKSDRSMSRGDKTAIYDMLKEVYVSDKIGYADGYSDQKLAEALGVPRAWVSTIRDEFFGEEITSENIRERVKEAHELLAKIKLLVPHFEEAKKLFGLADTMERELAQIVKVLK